MRHVSEALRTGQRVKIVTCTARFPQHVDKVGRVVEVWSDQRTWVVAVRGGICVATKVSAVAAPAASVNRATNIPYERT